MEGSKAKFVVEFEEDVVKYNVMLSIRGCMEKSKEIRKSGMRNGVVYSLPHGLKAYMWKTKAGTIKLRIWGENQED